MRGRPKAPLVLSGTRTANGADNAAQDRAGAGLARTHCAGLRRGRRQQDGRDKTVCHLLYGFEVAFAIHQSPRGRVARTM